MLCFCEKAKNIKEKVMGNFLLAITSSPGDTLLVCVLGIGIVFIGLALMIGVVYLMNFIVDKLSGKTTQKKAEPQKQPTVATNEVIPNREELAAAICAAIAEEEGTDISAIRVLSIKKVN